MTALLNGIRNGNRSLLKPLAFTAVVIVTLAVGTSAYRADSAVFSVVNSFLINPLPFPALGRTVAVWEKQPSQGAERNEASMTNCLQRRAQDHHADSGG